MDWTGEQIGDWTQDQKEHWTEDWTKDWMGDWTVGQNRRQDRRWGRSLNT